MVGKNGQISGCTDLHWDKVPIQSVGQDDQDAGVAQHYYHIECQRDGNPDKDVVGRADPLGPIYNHLCTMTKTKLVVPTLPDNM